MGIFRTWAECEAQVKGFSGAIYKSFLTEKEAKDYLNSNSANAVKSSKSAQNTTDSLPITIYSAYVDGSYDPSTETYGMGAVIVKDEDKVVETYFSGSTDHYKAMRNVAGEIKGAMWAMQWCLEHNIKEITLGYDYQGIRAWALGEWKTNKPETADYARFYKEISSDLTVYFLKIAAHTGHEFNDMADALAKKGAGIR